MTHAGAETAAGPSGSGTVVLELGPGAGALILHTPADMNGAEIDISTASGSRTHSIVRPRHVAGGTQYAAVYPRLAPAEYTIWRSDGTPAADVAVTAGAVATARWPVWPAP
jgi:hypothetical protein